MEESPGCRAEPRGTTTDSGSGSGGSPRRPRAGRTPPWRGRGVAFLPCASTDLRRRHPGPPGGSGAAATAAADLQAGRWMHVRLVLSGEKAALFLGDSREPVLVVPRLARGGKGGFIALRSFLGANIQGDVEPPSSFANVVVRSDVVDSVGRAARNRGTGSTTGSSCGSPSHCPSASGSRLRTHRTGRARPRFWPGSWPPPGPGDSPRRAFAQRVGKPDARC